MLTYLIIVFASLALADLGTPIVALVTYAVLCAYALIGEGARTLVMTKGHIVAQIVTTLPILVSILALQLNLPSGERHDLAVVLIAGLLGVHIDNFVALASNRPTSQPDMDSARRTRTVRLVYTTLFAFILVGSVIWLI